MKKILFASALLLTLSQSAFAGNIWVRGFVQESCPHMCERDGLQAVEGGVHQSGGRFYTCAAADGRPGYQLLGYANNQCAIGWGGKEVGHSTFYCLCTDGSGQAQFKD